MSKLLRTVLKFRGAQCRAWGQKLKRVVVDRHNFHLAFWKQTKPTLYAEMMQ